MVSPAAGNSIDDGLHVDVMLVMQCLMLPDSPKLTTPSGTSGTSAPPSHPNVNGGHR
jgi:hypothetical protein